ncbi:MAG TPA: glycosyltransferase [Pseudonocardiaceae bacterium]|nr:glycosyltransferase [Pseudonocardiaceae bacterium]
MRILFSAVQVFGHLYPMLPLARAFRARGDEVAFLGPHSVRQILAGEDFEVITAGPEVPHLVAELVSRTGQDPLAGAISAETEAELFAGVRVDLSFDDALAAARQWGADLIVGDVYDCLGPLVASVLNVRFGTVTLGPALLPVQNAALRSRVTLRYQALRVTPRRPLFVADSCPPLLQSAQWEKPEGWLPLRPEAYHAPGGSPVTTVRHDNGKRPQVLLTFGTLFGAPKVLGPLINDIAMLDVDLRVTLGPIANPEDFDVEHDRVRFEPFRPLAELLSDVDVVVNHAGAGTTIGALAAGVPLVLLPQGADQFTVAERAAASGAARRLLPDEITPGRLRDAVTGVLTSPEFRDSAAKVAAQIADMPTASDVAAKITMLLD